MQQPSDPRDSLVQSLAEQLSGLLGRTAAVTRLVNAPPMPGKSGVVALFSFPDGTSGAIAQLDLSLVCQIASILTGGKPQPASYLETAGHLPADMRDAISECCNVLAGLFNTTLKRRIKLTGVAILPLQADYAEAGGAHLPCLVGFQGMSGGRLDLYGHTLDEIATAAKAQATESTIVDVKLLATTLTRVLGGFCNREVTVEPGSMLALKPDVQASVAEYAPHGGTTSMLIISEMALSAYLGAAPMLIPRARALEQITSGKLDGTLYDGLYEAFNILAAPYAARHIRLVALHWLPGAVPPTVRSLIPSSGRLPAFTVDIAGYGSGRMALVGDCRL